MIIRNTVFDSFKQYLSLTCQQNSNDYNDNKESLLCVHISDCHLNRRRTYGRKKKPEHFTEVKNCYMRNFIPLSDKNKNSINPHLSMRTISPPKPYMDLAGLILCKDPSPTKMSRSLFSKCDSSAGHTYTDRYLSSAAVVKCLAKG